MGMTKKEALEWIEELIDQLGSEYVDCDCEKVYYGEEMNVILTISRARGQNMPYNDHKNRKENETMVKETRELYEERIVELLTKMETLDMEGKEYQHCLAAVDILSDKLSVIEKNTADAEDKAEKRRIEEEKNAAQAETEREKQKIGWKKVTFEMAKILAPVVAGGVIFKKIHEEVMEFEEEGRITSTSGRNVLNLASRFFKM